MVADLRIRIPPRVAAAFRMLEERDMGERDAAVLEGVIPLPRADAVADELMRDRSGALSGLPGLEQRLYGSHAGAGARPADGRGRWAHMHAHLPRQRDLRITHERLPPPCYAVDARAGLGLGSLSTFTGRSRPRAGRRRDGHDTIADGVADEGVVVGLPFNPQPSSRKPSSAAASSAPMRSAAGSRSAGDLGDLDAGAAVEKTRSAPRRMRPHTSRNRRWMTRCRRRATSAAVPRSGESRVLTWWNPIDGRVSTSSSHQPTRPTIAADDGQRIIAHAEIAGSARRAVVAQLPAPWRGRGRGDLSNRPLVRLSRSKHHHAAPPRRSSDRAMQAAMVHAGDEVVEQAGGMMRTGRGRRPLATSPFTSARCSPGSPCCIYHGAPFAPIAATPIPRRGQTRRSVRRRWPIRSAMVPSLRRDAGRRPPDPSCGHGAVVVHDLADHAGGVEAARRAKSTAASVWPARTSVPPSRATAGRQDRG